MGAKGLTIIANPQWRTEGQIVPDFGFLPWQRKANEELVASFTEVGGCGYSHAQTLDPCLVQGMFLVGLARPLRLGIGMGCMVGCIVRARADLGR